MQKVGFISLGCVKNLVDTEVMLGALKDRGFELTADPQNADVLIVNTCAFIETAKNESITAILNMADYKKIGKCKSLIIAGCLGQRYQQDLLDEIPEADAIVGTGAWHRIDEAVAETLKGKRVLLIGETDTIYDEKMTRITTTPEYSAYIKVAEGCNNRCSYCVIPLVRGNYRSRTIESIVAEAKSLTDKGVKEINLIAQDTTNYGHDLYGKSRLTDLLKALVKIEKLQWIRILYCYPKYFTDELIELMAAEPKICKYVDLPLQHADNTVLKAMARYDTRESIEALLKKIRNKIPNVTIRTSFIVGFPGETEEQYLALKSFVEEQRFDKVGVFTYSREEDTPAYEMDDQIDDVVKQERYHDLMSLQCKISEELNQEMEGKEIEVLIEGRDTEQETVAYGRSYREAPEVDGQVYVECDSDSKPGDMIKAKIVQGFTYDILAEKITE